MNVLVLNSGSSSIKFQVIGMPSESLACEGIVERIGTEEAHVRYKAGGHTSSKVRPILTHRSALEIICSLLLAPDNGIISNASGIGAVGHRVVHGGTVFSETTRVTGKVKEEIASFIPLAPLHNPHNLTGIQIAEELFPGAAQVAVFDTAFHRTMPLKARKYAIPDVLFRDYGIQAYGFHGTSHKYVSEKAIAHLGKQGTRILCLHLGNGCSITAVKDGKSMDHSLGFGPLNGLIMGTRSGDIDHSLIFYLVETLGYALPEVQRLLTMESGLLGLTGHSDLRDIQEGAAAGNADCKLAFDMSAYRIRKYIGAYTAVLNGLDALVFTAGIGENSAYMRKLVCADLEFLGIHLDEEKNVAPAAGLREIQSATSKVTILVIPTNEELEIARQTYNLVG